MTKKEKLMGDGCFNTLAGCFLYLFLFAIIYILIQVFLGIFWIALVGAIAFIVFFGLVIAFAKLIAGIFKKKK